jgi:uncharacterized protein
MTDFIYRYRTAIIVVSILISLAGALLVPFAETDPDVRNYIPQSLRSRKNTDKIEDSFGARDIVMILFRDSSVLNSRELERISSITDELSLARGVEDVMSLSNAISIRGEEGFMVVEPAMAVVPTSSVEMERLKASLSENSLVMGSVISDDFTTAVIIVSLNDQHSETRLLTSIDSLIDKYPGSAEVLKGGLPYIRAAIMSDVRRDGLILVPLALVIMLFLLRLLFREWRGVVIPFTVVVMSLAFTMGLAPLFGWKLSVISLLVPVMLIAIANNYGIHLIARYQEIDRNNDNITVRHIITNLMRSLRQPVVFTGLTTMAGLLGLLTHSIVPARQVGILTAAGVGYALILSLLFIPSWLSLLPRPVVKTSRKSDGLQRERGRWLNHIAAMVANNARMIFIVSMVATFVLGAGILFIRTDSNQENFFPPSHPIKMASNAINENFGGSQNISILIEADLLDPDNMMAIDQWSTGIAEKAGVGNVISIATAVREMSRALFMPGEQWYDGIPDSGDALAQIVELFNMSGDPEDFSQLVDLGYTKAQIIIRVNEPTHQNIREIIKSVAQLEENIKGTVTTGGYAYIMDEFAGRILKGQIYSILFALTTIFILLVIIFRSLKGGLIGTIPMAASVVILLGIMGWTGIPIDSATALLSSVMIGVGVDYTIHFIWRYCREIAEGKTPADSATTAVATTGRGIIFNALSVMAGFSVLALSGFTSIRFFGYLVIISVGVCLLSSLLTVPAIMILLKPKFAGDLNSIVKK